MTEGYWSGNKTQMGTIFDDNSHFIAFNRSLLQRQVTVIVVAYFPGFRPYGQASEKSACILPPALLPAGI